MDNEYAILEPVLTFAKATIEPYIADLATRLDWDPSPPDVVHLITEVMPLNTKQKQTILMIFYYILQH